LKPLFEKNSTVPPGPYDLTLRLRGESQHSQIYPSLLFHDMMSLDKDLNVAERVLPK
jgi:hypothetical protein